VQINKPKHSSIRSMTWIQPPIECKRPSPETKRCRTRSLSAPHTGRGKRRRSRSAALPLTPAEPDVFSRSLRGQSGFDSRRYFRRVRGGLRLEAFDDLAVATDEELAEVPFDVTRERRFLARERNVERMAFRSVHVDFVEQRKRDVILAGAKLLNLLI